MYQHNCKAQQKRRIKKSRTVHKTCHYTVNFQIKAVPDSFACCNETWLLKKCSLVVALSLMHAIALDSYTNILALAPITFILMTFEINQQMCCVTN